MAKSKTVVDRSKLEAAIQKAEADGPLDTQNQVWIKTAEIYNATNGESISHSIVMLRAKEFGITIQTKGARGRGRKMSPDQIAKMQAARGKRVSKADKFKANPIAQESLLELRKQTPERWHSLVDQVAAGSRTAAVKLNCLACVAFDGERGPTYEIKHCPCTQCPMWLFRPYKPRLNEKPEPDED